jgi:diacylglycerol kinase (ATP)
VEPLLLITNAEAGGDDADLERALTVLRSGSDVEVCRTGAQGELDGVLHRRGGRRVVVAGGDGSLHAVISALHRRHELEETTLALLPLGTGNDFARGVGIPLDIEKAARIVLDGTVREVDLIVDCLGEIVVNNVHIGVGAEASRNAHRWKEKLGRAGYFLGAAMAAVNPPFVRLRVEVDGEVVTDIDQPVLQVAIGNGARVGGGTALTPEAQPRDGKMDVLVSYAVGLPARIGYAARLGQGRHHERSDVTYVRGTQVTVSGQGFYCSADGELFGPERNRGWHLEPGAFSMSLP